MSQRTIWSSKVIETFNGSSSGNELVQQVVSPTITNPTAVVNNRINSDERIITGAVAPSSGDAEEKPPETEPAPPPSLSSIKTPADAFAYYKSTVNSTLRNGDKKDAPPDGEDYPWRSMMDGFLKAVDIDPYSEKGRKYSKVMASQFNIWYLAVPVSYVIVINWWYLWNYTDFTFDFRSLLNYFPMKWPIEPFLYAIEYINYSLIGFRVDSEPKSLFGTPEEVREWLRQLWDYRPITFTFFYACLAGLFIGVPEVSKFSDTMAAFLIGETTFLTPIIILLSIFFFAFITLKPERDIEYIITAFPVSIFLKIFMFFLSLVFASLIGPMVLGVYLYFISFYAMPIFCWQGFSFIHMWPWRTFQEFLRIYYDLSEAPVKEPETNNVFKKIQYLLFQECQNLFMLFVVCLSILIVHITEAVEVMESTPLLLTFMILFNAFMVLTISNGMEITLMKLWNISIDILNSIAHGSSELPTKGISEV